MIVQQAGLESRHKPVYNQQSLKALRDLKSGLEHSAILSIANIKGDILEVNKNFTDIFHYTEEEIKGKNHRVLNSGYHPKMYFSDLWETIRAGKVWRGEIRDRSGQGCLYWVDTTIIPLVDERERPYQFMSISYDITRRKEMESKLSSLPQRIFQAQELERDRISREIHDDLGQSLAALKMMVQSIVHGAEPVPYRQKRELKKIIKYADSIIEKSRNLASGLKPSTVENKGMTSAIRGLVRAHRKYRDIKILLRLGQLDDVIFQGDAINLYRIIQEVLRNIITHAQAASVEILFRKTLKKLTMTVKDDGKGFEHKKVRQGKGHPYGLGLSTMQERAKLLKGDLYIESRPGEGTIVRLMIPIAIKGKT